MMEGGIHVGQWGGIMEGGIHVGQWGWYDGGGYTCRSMGGVV